jgi:hypothetical protein
MAKLTLGFDFERGIGVILVESSIEIGVLLTETAALLLGVVIEEDEEEDEEASSGRFCFLAGFCDSLEVLALRLRFLPVSFSSVLGVEAVLLDDDFLLADGFAVPSPAGLAEEVEGVAEEAIFVSVEGEEAEVILAAGLAAGASGCLKGLAMTKSASLI